MDIKVTFKVLFEKIVQRGMVKDD